jgi:flotillin
MPFAFPLLANEGTIILATITAVLLLGTLLGALAFAAKYYRRCPSNRVLVVFGKSTKGQSATCVHGGARLVWPLIQDYKYLSLEPMQIEIPLRGALSIENIRVNVPSVFTVATGTTPELMQNAAIRLLGLSQAEISKQAEDIIFGQLRQVIASMEIEEINRNRDSFLNNIQSSLDPELQKIGLVLINVNITDITDESGYIEAIGKKAASLAIQKARGDVADNEKMGEIRVAEAEREKFIQVANATKVQKIGTREAERDQAVRVAEMERDQQVGEKSADFERAAQVKDAEREMRIQIAEMNRDQEVGEQSAEYEKDTQVKDAERAMRIRIAEANARAVEGENVSQAEIAKSQAELKYKQSEAYEMGETRKREAEASVLEAEHNARTKAAVAEGLRIEAKRRAEVEAPAKADKAKTIVDAEAVAERRRIEAEGEASAIFAKLDAEARGQYEMLAKKGDGLQKIIDACGGAEQAFQLMLLEHFDNLVDASAKAISNIKFDKVVVWDGGVGSDGKSATSSWLNNMAHTLPPMLQVMKDVGGVNVPETLTQLQGLAGEDGEKSSGASVKPTPVKSSTATVTKPANVKPSKPAAKIPPRKPGEG